MRNDDAALMSAIRDGSDLAFNTLIDRHQQAVRAFLRRLLGNMADAEDLAQETFLTAWTHARSYRGDSSVRSWLCGIAWRKAKSAQRSWTRRCSRDTAAELTSPDDARSGSLEDRLAIRQALLTLPIEQRAAVTLCLVCGFSHSEAAAIIGVPLGTLKSHVSRGRERLREAIGGEI
jgi:RNA polymerase sigma-70 factor (ECF subfamily)